MHTENNLTTENTTVIPKIMVGTDEFCDLLMNSDIFVDKSLLIKEVLEDSGKIILITRPRRWGKTINMDMVRRFLEIEIDPQGNPLPLEERQNIKLFTGGTINIGFDETKTLQPLKIALHEDILKYQGQFPVISITFKNIEGKSYQEIEQGVKIKLRNLFQEHNYLMHSAKLKQYEKDKFAVYLSNQITKSHITNSLSLLTELLYKHYNREAWVLIDAYDTPIINAYSYFGKNEHAFEKVLALLDGIMNATFKRGTGGFYLERGFITGIFRIAKSTLFASFNNASEYSLLDKKFSKSYGFTQPEVDELLTKVPMDTDPKKIKDWYNGYTFGDEVIYNPWSIMQCLSHKGKLDNYWIDSGGTALIDKAFVSDEIQEDLQCLASGQAIFHLLLSKSFLRTFINQ
ncbi:MAG: AAA family ATPase [Amoebophilaceae bacterium]|nr:AAA family ATPase [Amoebophilaceae bacterium]